jgi:hypothetical protein
MHHTADPDAQSCGLAKLSRSTADNAHHDIPQPFALSFTGHANINLSSLKLPSSCPWSIMEERSHRKRRIAAVVAATCVSLACGTNYAYSAWGPQFAEKLKLSATQSNLIVRFALRPVCDRASLTEVREPLAMSACMRLEYPLDLLSIEEVRI